MFKFLETLVIIPVNIRELRFLKLAFCANSKQAESQLPNVHAGNEFCVQLIAAYRIKYA